MDSTETITFSMSIKSVLEKEEGFDRNEPLTQAKLSETYTQYKIKPYWEK